MSEFPLIIFLPASAKIDTPADVVRQSEDGELKGYKNPNIRLIFKYDFEGVV